MYLMSGATEALSLNYSVVVVVVLFVAYHLLLKGMFYKPFFRTLKQRETETEGKLHAAVAADHRRKEIAGELEAALRAARQEAAAAVDRARLEAARDQGERLDALQEELRVQVETARKDIAEQAALSRKRLQDDIERFGRMAAERILARELQS
ncbi:MAG: hypothetical protein KA419_05715 [Acidobacteria bacterium]|nr:hypothetical protein [Acidobacteriota bacterium]